MNLEGKLWNKARVGGARFIRYVDISELSLEENRGYSGAILLGIALSPQYVDKLGKDENVDWREFSFTEHQADKLAEKISEYLMEKGYKSYAQSESNLLAHGDYKSEIKTTPLPHKTIAILAGLGWIGKNNLLVTKEYGSALCMCTVLTNGPIKTTVYEIYPSKCKGCQVCKNICPSQVITGKEWKVGVRRDELVNVYKCATCLKCLANCPWTKQYIKKTLNT